MNKYSKPAYNAKNNQKPTLNFSNYKGTFICQKCNAQVNRARFWKDTFDFTWMCECRFVSKVNLNVRGY